jgi:riboflavin synthase
MFTGLIQSVGQVVDVQKKAGDLEFKIATNFKNMSDVVLGDSIAINGICLTVTQFEGQNIWVDVSVETINKTNISSWQVGTKLNLEKSLTLQDKLGGHMVSGHVDAMGECVEISQSARSTIYQFKIPQHLDKYIVNKGSIGVNGVSLTVNTIENNIFSVNLIPHTLDHTNLGLLSVGDSVNIEIDTIARYVEKMLNIKAK